MISVDEAQALIAQQIRPGKIETMQLDRALGMTLAQRVISKAPSPRFDMSAVDGYAVSERSISHQSPGTPVNLPVTEAIQAGETFKRSLKPSETLRIFTGARVPKGTYAIVMQEDVSRQGDQVSFGKLPKAGAHIRRKGKEYGSGTVVFERGEILTPARLGTIAALGYSRLKVNSKPVVGIIVTGNELRSPGEALKGSEVWDANSTSLVAALQSGHIPISRVVYSKDSESRIQKSIASAMRESDIVITTGGISVGDHDHVRGALQKLGVKEIFWRVSLRPGMPIYFGKLRAGRKMKYVFALPGNPVSALVTFHLFIQPALQRWIGRPFSIAEATAILTSTLTKHHDRREFVRGISGVGSEGELVVTPLDARESHMMTGLANANCLIEMKEKVGLIPKDTQVRIFPLNTPCR